MIVFHRVLIGSAIAFFAVLTLWALAGFRSGGDLGLLVLGLVSALAAAGLSYYLRHLHRFLGR
jgi:hypothetical protein